MNRKPLTFLSVICFSFLATSCDWMGGIGETAVFDATFNLATAGNMLNPNYSTPEIGPEGFISYKSYFTSCSVVLDYDSSIVFSYELTDGTSGTKEGHYTSKTPEKNNVLIATYPNETLSYIWPNYYEFFIVESYNLPGLGNTEVTCLFHATVIFTRTNS